VRSKKVKAQLLVIREIEAVSIKADSDDSALTDRDLRA
jgi:hypothetical protein